MIERMLTLPVQVYDMDDIHLDASIYADPRKWDPSRYLPGREEHKKQAHGYLGWGSGLHPCRKILRLLEGN